MFSPDPGITSPGWVLRLLRGLESRQGRQFIARDVSPGGSEKNIRNPGRDGTGPTIAHPRKTALGELAADEKFSRFAAVANQFLRALPSNTILEDVVIDTKLVPCIWGSTYD